MRYMIEVNIPELLWDEMMDLLPNDISRINELMEAGIMHSYIITEDYRKIWLLLNAESREEVELLLQTFEVYEKVQVEIYPVNMEERSELQMPMFSLN